MKRFRVVVEYEYLADSTQEEQVINWSRHMDRVGLPLPATSQVPGTGAATLISVVEVMS